MEQIQIIGNLGRDAEIKVTNSKEFMTFNVACSTSYKDASGNKVERTTWYDCTTEKTAVAQYLKRGTKVFVQGRPKINQYTTSKGEAGASFQISVSRIELLSSLPKKEGEENG